MKNLEIVKERLVKDCLHIYSIPAFWMPKGSKNPEELTDLEIIKIFMGFWNWDSNPMSGYISALQDILSKEDYQKLMLDIENELSRKENIEILRKTFERGVKNLDVTDWLKR